MQVLGIIGALDPHTHKTNQADLQGEGKLEREGVRPQRQHPSAVGQPGDSIGRGFCTASHSLSLSPGPIMDCALGMHPQRQHYSAGGQPGDSIGRAPVPRT